MVLVIEMLWQGLLRDHAARAIQPSKTDIFWVSHAPTTGIEMFQPYSNSRGVSTYSMGPVSCAQLAYCIFTYTISFALLYTTRSLFSLLPTPLAKVSRSASYRRLCALLTLGATFPKAA